MLPLARIGALARLKTALSTYNRHIIANHITLSSGGNLTPFDKGVRAVFLVNGAAVEIEVVVDHRR
jgi:hypothetical protein